MNKLMALMTAGSMTLAFTPVAFAQSASSASSTSSTSSTSSLSSSSSTSSSSSLSSASVYSRPSRSKSSASVMLRGRARQTQTSVSSRASQPGRGVEQRNERARLVPEQCQDVKGRARALCVQRLTKPTTTRSSRSSVSSSSTGSTMTGSNLTNDQMLRRLLGIGNSRGGTDLMRMLCGLSTGKLDSACADSNMMQFNRNLHDWYLNLGQSLSLFMRALNGTRDTSSSYFWNNAQFPFSNTGTGATVKGWSFMNETDTTPLLDAPDPMMDQSMMWEACQDREGRSKARCMREYMNMQWTEDSGEVTP